MKRLLALSRWIDALSAGFGVIADWLVLLAVLVSAGNAAARYLFNAGSNAFLEIQWYFFGGVVFLGAAYTLCRNEHVRVDVLYGSLGNRARLFIDIFGLVVFLLPAMVFLAWLSWPVFTQAFRSGEVSSNYGGLIRWPILLTLPVGFTLVALQGVSELIKRLAALAGDYAFEADYQKPLQ